MTKIPLFRIGAEFTAQFPSRKMNKAKTGNESYAAQTRESTIDVALKRVQDGMGNRALRFVAVATPEAIATEPGGDTMELIGHIVDEEAAAPPAAKKRATA